MESQSVKKSSDPDGGWNEYHSVVIVAGSNACSDVRALEGQYLLAHEAPFLPIQTCNQRETCHCIYLHHSDRRHTDRRRDFLQSAIVREECRSGRERRREGTWRQSNREPSGQDVKNAAKQLNQIVERLIDHDADVTLDDFYHAMDYLREDLEYRVLLDS